MKHAAMVGVRVIAGVLLLVALPAFGGSQPALAELSGGCLPQSGHGCITAHKAYSDKKCSGTGCITCAPEPGAVCTGCGGDVDDTFNPSIGC